MQRAAVRRVTDDDRALIFLVPETHVTLCWSITRSLLEHDDVELAVCEDRNAHNALVTHVEVPEEDWYHKRIRLRMADGAKRTPQVALRTAIDDVRAHLLALTASHLSTKADR